MMVCSFFRLALNCHLILLIFCLDRLLNMLLQILASPLLGLYYLSSNFLQAAGNAFLATIVSILRQGALLIPCLYLMHSFFGLTGIAAAHTVSDVCAVIIAVSFCLWQYRKLAGIISKQ